MSSRVQREMTFFYAFQPSKTPIRNFLLFIFQNVRRIGKRNFKRVVANR